MKTAKLTVLLLLLPLLFHAQSLTGLWTGTLSNDSNTVRRDQSFEIVLTQYKDKVFGYSRMTFFVGDSLYYIVKRVKGTVEGDVCEVKDADVISHNFPQKPDKGVKLVSTFRRNLQDSTWRLDGDWKTTESKKHGYYSISGRIDLREEKDIEKSKIIPHLEELKLADDVAFIKEAKESRQEAVAAANRPPQITSSTSTTAASTQTVAPAVVTKEEHPKTTTTEKQPAETTKPLASPASGTIAKQTVPPAIVKEEPVKSPPETQQADIPKPVTPVVVHQTGNAPASPSNSESVKENKPSGQAIANTKQPAGVITASKPSATNLAQEPVIVKSAEKPAAKAADPASAGSVDKSVTKQTNPPASGVNTTAPPANKPIVAQTGQPAQPAAKQTVPVVTTPDKQPVNAITKAEPKATAPVIIPEKKPATTPPAPATVISNSLPSLEQRKTVPQQVVYFHSDSLELALYDNGEVDGDTVSVLINGELVLAKQGLKTTAIKKKVYVPAGQIDSITLTLYAENLGKYPPNTGLVVVHDGDDVYQVRFSADLQQNAAVIFRRKSK